MCLDLFKRLETKIHMNLSRNRPKPDHPTDRHYLYLNIYIFKYEDSYTFFFIYIWFGRENRFQHIHTSNLPGIVWSRVRTHARTLIPYAPDVQIKSLNKCIDARGAKNELLMNFDRNAHCIRSVVFDAYVVSKYSTAYACYVPLCKRQTAQ